MGHKLPNDRSYTIQPLLEATYVFFGLIDIQLVTKNKALTIEIITALKSILCTTIQTDSYSPSVETKPILSIHNSFSVR